MKRVRKINRILLILVLMVSFISIGYAAIQTSLNINGATEIKKNSWNVHFENIKVYNGSITPTEEAKITNATTVTFNVPLSLPGDFYKFDVDVVNAGSIDAMINSVLKTPVLTPEQSKYMIYDVQYKDAVIPEVKVKDRLSAGDKRTITVYVKYREDLNAGDLPTTDQDLTLNFGIDYVQDDGTSNEVVVFTTANDLIAKANPVGKDYNSSTAEEKGNMYTFTHPATIQVPTEVTDYRYIGNTPNNYIKFNNETWRIIGVFDGRIKIIKDESIGNFAWDSTSPYENEWSTSTLAAKLNSGDYWSTLTPESQEQIDTVTYYLGGSSTYSGLGASDYYNFERGTTVYSGRSTNWEGKVGLMYPSDYVYTFANGVDDKCFTDAYNCDTSTPSSSWLYKNSYIQWTIAPYSGHSDRAFRVDSDGYVGSVDYSGFVGNAYGVRPVAYLKSDIGLQGSGTSTDPFTIKK